MSASPSLTYGLRVRYLIPLAFATMLIAAGGLFVWHTFHSLGRAVRDSLRRAKEAGTLPPELQDVNPDAADLKIPDMQIKLPSGLHQRIQIAYLLMDWWYLWVPLILVAAVGSSALLGRDRSTT
jgi:hypothetical protein